MKQTYLTYKQGEINSQFSKIRNKSKLTGWLMRQYFDANKNSADRWYNKSVNSGNVLAYVSDPLNRFPLTPVKVVDMFTCIQSFKKSLKKLEKECSLDDLISPKIALEAAQKKKKTAVKYQTGEETLKSIGEELGGLTPTMINKLSVTAFEKVRKLSDNQRLDELAPGRGLEKFIMDSRIHAALEYAKNLKKHKGSIKGFIDSLVKARVMTKNEALLITKEEKEALRTLKTEAQGDIVTTLLKDITRDQNLFKTYQSAVHRQAFPEKKRGRPRKNPKAYDLQRV